MIGVYVHVPFCRQKCPYCHFFTVPYRKELEEEFLGALLYEAEDIEDKNDTLYLGGGTPSVLTAGVLEKLAKKFIHDEVREAAIEVNPEDSVDFSFLKGLGFNRVSIAAVSFSSRTLSYLGRRHTPSDIFARLEEARKAGFEDINLDILYGIPGHKLDNVLKDIKTALDLGASHISYYLLEIPRYFSLKDRVPWKEEELERQYYEGRDLIESEGLKQYEVSNFAKPGYESYHNLKYWKFLPYIGLGPAAASLYGRKRWENRKSLMAYIGAWKRKDSIPRQVFKLSEDEFLREKIMMGLRLVEGVKFTPSESNQARKYLERARRLENEGLVQVSVDGIRINRDRFFVMNSIILEIIG